MNPEAVIASDLPTPTLVFPSRDSFEQRRLLSSDPYQLIESLELNESYRRAINVPSGSWEGWIIRQHTAMFLDGTFRYDLYGKESVLSRYARQIGYLYHDAGKINPLTGEKYTRKDIEHEQAIQLLLDSKDLFSVSDHELTVISEMIRGHNLASFFGACFPNRLTKEEYLRMSELIQRPGFTLERYDRVLSFVSQKIFSEAIKNVDEIVEITAKRIRTSAERCGLTPLDFLDIEEPYIQADCLAYTLDARTSQGERGRIVLDISFERNHSAQSFNDNLFLKHPEEGRLLYREPLETVRRLLVQALK